MDVLFLVYNYQLLGVVSGKSPLVLSRRNLMMTIPCMYKNNSTVILPITNFSQALLLKIVFNNIRDDVKNDAY